MLKMYLKGILTKTSSSRIAVKSSAGTYSISLSRPGRGLSRYTGRQVIALVRVAFFRNQLTADVRLSLIQLWVKLAQRNDPELPYNVFSAEGFITGIAPGQMSFAVSQRASFSATVPSAEALPGKYTGAEAIGTFRILRVQPKRGTDLITVQLKRLRVLKSLQQIYQYRRPYRKRIRTKRAYQDVLR